VAGDEDDDEEGDDHEARASTMAAWRGIRSTNRWISQRTRPSISPSGMASASSFAIRC
jgi:hypothetical protein